MSSKIKTIDDFDYNGKRVLLRVDVNSPIDPESKKIINDSRFEKSIPTIRDLLEKRAKLVLIAHQGDTLDYPKLLSLREHASILSRKLGKKVQFIEDTAGPAAREKVRNLNNGEILLLENLRFFTEEVSTFENDVKLTAEQGTGSYIVRNLAPLMDCYVNDAFAAAHRNAPSMVSFQELLPSAAGRLLMEELKALNAIVENPARPCVFVLGGLKISDAYGMMRKVLYEGLADRLLTTGVTGQVMLMAKGRKLGDIPEKFITDRSLDKFIPESVEYLERFPEKVHFPVDLAVDEGGNRKELSIDELPADGPIIDIGENTIEAYAKILNEAGTIFVNGPAGIYEKEISQKGTARLWSIIAEARGFTVMGGGDTISSVSRLIDPAKIDFLSTGGGALIRYLSGQKLPVLEALEKAARRFSRIPK